MPKQKNELFLYIGLPLENDHLNKFIAVISAYPSMYTSYCPVVLLKVTLSGVDPLIEAYFATDSHVFDKIPQIMLIASPVSPYLNPIRKKPSRPISPGIFNVAPLPSLQYVSAFIFKLLLHRKNQVLFLIPGPPYSYCFFCFFFAALFQFVQSSPVYNAFPFTLSCLRTFWISSLPFLSAAIHKGL